MTKTRVIEPTPKNLHMNIRETTELLRAASAILIECIEDMDDGRFSIAEKIKFVHLLPVVSQGIKGISQVPGELRDLDPDERDALIAEIKETLLKTGKFAHRTADVSEIVLDLAYHNIAEIARILRLPPVALPA